MRFHYDVPALEQIAADIRFDIIEVLGKVGAGHPGPSLSPVELLVALYFYEMDVAPKTPKWSDRDRFVLSKGHGAVGLYSVLAKRGFFDREELFTFESLNSRLQGHPDMLLTPGVEMSTGSLGQGVSTAVGMAIGAKLAGQDIRCYAIAGDGELEEGQIWEAAMTSAKYKLDNLVVMVDWNGLQGGVTLEVMPSLEPIVPKWEAFGWHVQEIDGHDMGAVVHALDSARATKGKPSVIIARTVKGKGISFMENRPEWHSKKLAGDELAQAYSEVRLQLEKVAG